MESEGSWLVVLKICLKTALEFVELHRTINYENIYFKNWRGACIHSPTWTMFSSDHLWALLTSRTEQPIFTTEGGWGLLPCQPTHLLWMRNRRNLGGQHSALQNRCAPCFPPTMLESSHILSMCLRQDENRPKEAIFHHSRRKGGLQAWGASGGGELGPKGSELAEKSRCGPQYFASIQCL